MQAAERLALERKETEEPVGIRGKEIWFELVEGHGEALLLGDNELQLELAVVHVPELDDAVLPAASHQVVLVELRGPLGNFELAGRQVLEVGSADGCSWRMAGLNLDGRRVGPGEVP